MRETRAVAEDPCNPADVLGGQGPVGVPESKGERR